MAYYEGTPLPLTLEDPMDNAQEIMAMLRSWQFWTLYLVTTVLFGMICIYLVKDLAKSLKKLEELDNNS